MACAAINCKNKVGEAPGKSFHRFPRWNPALFQVWIKNFRHQDSWKPTLTSVLCSDHFEASCFDTIGNIKHIRADAVPTLFFEDDKPRSNDSTANSKEIENPQIISVISLDNLFKTSPSDSSSVPDPLRVFHEKIDEICKQKRNEKKRKILLQLLLSFKRFSVNQQKIKTVINRSRLLRRKMMQSAMMMIILTQQQLSINS